jgi:hypothetical protein
LATIQVENNTAMRGGGSDQPFSNGFAHGFDLRLHMQLVIAVFDLGANGFEADTNSATISLRLFPFESDCKFLFPGRLTGNRFWWLFRACAK